MLRVCCVLWVVPGLYWALSGILAEMQENHSKMAFRPYFIGVKGGGRYWTRTSDLVHVRPDFIPLYSANGIIDVDILIFSCCVFVAYLPRMWSIVCNRE